MYQQQTPTWAEEEVLERTNISCVDCGNYLSSFWSYDRHDEPRLVFYCSSEGEEKEVNE